MIVFVIHHGSRYEGGHAVAVAKTWVAAQRVVDRLIAAHNVEQQEIKATWDEENAKLEEGSEPYNYQIQTYKRQPGPEAYWLSEFEIISIREFTLEE